MAIGRWAFLAPTAPINVRRKSQIASSRTSAVRENSSENTFASGASESVNEDAPADATGQMRGRDLQIVDLGHENLCSAPLLP